MRSKKWTLALTLTLITMGVFTSCGRASREDVLPIPAPIYPGPVPTYPVPTPTPSPTDGFLPAITFSFSMTGTNGTTPTFATPSMNTDSILKVKVTAGPAQLNTGGSGFQGTYSCLAVNVTAIGQTVSTVNLATAGAGSTATTSQCPGAPHSQIIDFSNRLTPGHGPVSISVSAARYDYYCNEFWIYYMYYGPYGSPYGSNPGLYCPMHVVYQNHVISGNLDIQVNGTSLP
ncbi:MAG: hypothetical protein AABZ55_01305 [Bdellovibrionota bacterium]